MKVKKIVKFFIKSLLGLLFLSAMFVSWLVFTETGLNVALALGSQWLPGNLNIGKAEGTLWNGFSMEAVVQEFTVGNQLKFDTLKIKIETRKKNRLLKIQCQDLLGIYQGQRMQGQGGITFHQGQWQFEPLQFKMGENEIRVTPQPETVGWANVTFKGKFSPKAAQVVGQSLIKTKDNGFIFEDIKIFMNQKKILGGNAEIALPEFSISKLSWQNLNIKHPMLALRGNYQLRLLDLGPIYHWLPMISRLKASVSAQGQIQGHLFKPQVSIEASLKNAIFSIPKQRVTVKNFSCDLLGIVNEALMVKAQGYLGGNPFYLQGFWSPFAKETLGEFDFKGKDIRIFNTDNIRVIISPNMKLNFLPDRLMLTGTVHIEDADIYLKENLKHQNYSNDVVFVGSKKPQIFDNSKPLFRIVPKIRLIIQDNVRFKGHGLDAELRGDIMIDQRVDGHYIGNGRLTIKRGKYRLPSGTGKISRGHLLYTPGTLLNDPLLDIRVVSQPMAKFRETAQVGVYIQGSLQDPKYHLFSSGHLEQGEVLSRLGYSGHEQEGQDRQWLSQTTLLLGGGANPIVSGIQSKFNLDEFGVLTRDAYKYLTAQEGSDMALVVGKSLGKRFYLQFLQGMVVPYSTLRLQYFLNPNFALGVESSTTGLGGDLSFSVEQK